MTSSDSNPIEALSELLEERRRYEGWLAQLEARRVDSPSHVVDRVRSDYLLRLDGVTQQLRGRASDLESSAATLRARIDALQADENGRRDERFELELRAEVGEFEPERAQESMAACDVAITQLGGERAGLEHELSRITEVLALVAPAPVAELEAVPPEAESSDDERVTAAAGDEANTADARDDTRDDTRDEVSHENSDERASALSTSSLMPPSPSPMDELAFLQSVVDGPREGTAPSSPDFASQGMHGSQRSADGADLLPPPTLTAPRRPVTPLSSSIPSTRDPLANTNSGSTLTPGSMPSFLRDMPTEQVKTLKCQECGTMNYPTEWYCERCGGELAAM
ncbi:MAG: hypothetical protein IT360_24415 [Gemmatimonadaceae bacterium]|nr:hypothetical protein [Gemmatimonadaceae bacterium]